MSDSDRLLAHKRDDILDERALRRLEKALLRLGARVGLEEYKLAWYHGAYEEGEGGFYELSEEPLISRAVDYAFDQVESGRVKPGDFRSYFRSQAKKRFIELADAALLEQQKRTTESEEA